jgi:hypothetical protein
LREVVIIMPQMLVENAIVLARLPRVSLVLPIVDILALRRQFLQHRLASTAHIIPLGDQSDLATHEILLLDVELFLVLANFHRLLLTHLSRLEIVTFVPEGGGWCEKETSRYHEGDEWESEEEEWVSRNLSPVPSSNRGHIFATFVAHARKLGANLRIHDFEALMGTKSDATARREGEEETRRRDQTSRGADDAGQRVERSSSMPIPDQVTSRWRVVSWVHGLSTFSLTSASSDVRTATTSRFPTIVLHLPDGPTLRQHVSPDSGLNPAREHLRPLCEW